MRALVLLLLAGCAAPPGPEVTIAPAALHGSWQDASLLDAEFLATPGTRSATLSVPHDAQEVRLRVTLDTGAGSRLRFEGLGGCSGFSPIGGPAAWTSSGQAHEHPCGHVSPGTHTLTWKSDGAFAGRIQVLARLPA